MDTSALYTIMSVVNIQNQARFSDIKMEINTANTCGKMFIVDHKN